MKIELDLMVGSYRSADVTADDMQKNIDAINRSIKKSHSADSVLLTDTRTILEAIQKQLPGHER